ncbi:class I SAM-dependent methyltransferase [Litoribacter alkaliphilus]|uniref:Class I SAM-dependent methyltransferase n=1 Tax=Litoribacter ruber TaxID=702568 RepID=A0AAP2CK74_9BACT|nr:class I SAM-dependent methyltransferase [Litoribacter alkaliphilus]MBS9525264.1 class I SAM-dependent methyltransferase [Litoribacter alkaliphilus]
MERQGKKSANYDPVALIYDGLAALVFLGAIRRSQRSVLNHIPDHTHILIVGGGTGWILQDIAWLQRKDLKVTFVDHSELMIRKAKKQVYQGLEVEFVQQSVQDLILSKTYDVVLTPFFFDNLTAKEANEAFSNINQSLKPQGIWLHVDFENSRFWHRAFLGLMYKYFSLLCNVQTSSLPPMARYFDESGFEAISNKGFFKGFISARVYKKLSTSFS